MGTVGVECCRPGAERSPLSFNGRVDCKTVEHCSDGTGGNLAPVKAVEWQLQIEDTTVMKKGREF